MAEQDDNDPKSWLKWLWNGGMSGIGSAISTLFDVVFWGAVLVGVYYLAKQFQGPIGDFLENCGLKGAAGENGFVHQAFAEGDKMIKEVIDGGKNEIGKMFPSLANNAAEKMTETQIRERLIKDGVPAAVAAVIAKPEHFKPFLETVKKANGNIMSPFEGEAGKTIVATVLAQQPQMVKQVILNLPANAGGGTGTAATGASTGQKAAIDQKTMTDLQVALKAIVSDPAQLKFLLSNADTRDVLVTAATKFSPVQFDANALHTLLAKVANDDTALGGVQTILAPLMDGATVNTAAQVKAVTSLLTVPEFAGVQGEMSALIKSLRSDNPEIQKNLKWIQEPLMEAVARAVGADVVGDLVATQGDGKAIMQVLQAHPEALQNVLKDSGLRGALVGTVADMTSGEASPVTFNPQALDDYLESIAEQPQAVEAITQLIPAVMMPSPAPEAIALRNKTLATLITTQKDNPKLPALLKSIELKGAFKNSDFGVALAFINTDGNFTHIKELINVITPGNAVKLLAAIGDKEQMTKLMKEVVEDPTKAKLLTVLQAFVAKVDKTALPQEMQEKLEFFSTATPEQLKMLVALPPEEFEKVIAAQKDLQNAGIDLTKLKEKLSSPEAALDMLLSADMAKKIGDPEIRKDILTVLPLGKAEKPTPEQVTTNAAINFLIHADANGKSKNLDVIGEFIEAIETNAKDNTTLDAQTLAVAKGLVAKLTGSKANAPLNAADVAAFFGHKITENNADNSTAFKTLLDGLDISSLPPAQQPLIKALKEHFYVADDDKGTNAHGLAFVLADKDGAKFLVDQLSPSSAPTDPKPDNSSLMGFLGQMGDAIVGVVSDTTWKSAVSGDVVSQKLLIASQQVPPSVIPHIGDVDALKAAAVPFAAGVASAPVR